MTMDALCEDRKHWRLTLPLTILLISQLATRWVMF